MEIKILIWSKQLMTDRKDNIMRNCLKFRKHKGSFKCALMFFKILQDSAAFFFVVYTLSLGHLDRKTELSHLHCRRKCEFHSYKTITQVIDSDFCLSSVHSVWMNISCKASSLTWLFCSSFISHHCLSSHSWNLMQ